MTNTFMLVVNPLGRLKCRASGVNYRQKILPRVHKRSGALLLKLRSEYVSVDPGIGKFPDDFVTVATVAGHDRTEFAMVRQSFQRSFRHGIYGERRSKRF